jgi:hypothetical protein
MQLAALLTLGLFQTSALTSSCSLINQVLLLIRLSGAKAEYLYLDAAFFIVAFFI